MTRRLALLLPLSAIASAACVVPKVSYVQPGYPRVRYEELAPSATPRPVQVSFVHLWDGERQEQLALQPKRRALAVLARSRLFSSVVEGRGGGASDHIDVVLERTSTRSPAPAYLGSGTYIHNRIVLTATLQTANAKLVRSYEHVIYSSIGYVKRPPVDGPNATSSTNTTVPSDHVGTEPPRPMFIMDALDEVTEALLLTFLRDVQAARCLD